MQHVSRNRCCLHLLELLISASYRSPLQHCRPPPGQGLLDRRRGWLRSRAPVRHSAPARSLPCSPADVSLSLCSFDDDFFTARPYGALDTEE